ncbi:HK97 gp10 family phage protein [Campylobacter sp. RM16191]|uniref:HK97 gp10 family phage protein n=1 Tax=Campylobacter sp. RM16191 TaxID=1705728 RepID=UPI001473CE72|nr:HK97 gp10 family phage protein [Campylobacter sp. RM16191]
MNFNTHLKNFIFRVGSGIANRAKIIAPIDTGNLKKDIQVFDDNINNFEVEIGNTKLAPYAKFVHEGTKPHVIKVKKMKALANKKTGQIFGKKVNHPGIKANPYLLNAADDFLGSLEFEKAKDRLAKDVENEVLKDIKASLKVK